MENKVTQTKLFELKNFTITFEVKNSSDIVVLIIGSAGLAFAGNKNIQEFKNIPQYRFWPDKQLLLLMDQRQK